MVNPAALKKDFDSVIKEGGEIVRIRYFSMSGATTGYDDDIAYTKSGTDFFVSGCVFPVGERNFNSAENALMQQGLLKNDDVKLYLKADDNFSVFSGTYRIGRGGSPTPTTEYGMAPDTGVLTHQIGGSPIYHKIYLRELPTGSYLGE